jgi:prophage regulatory protein
MQTQSNSIGRLLRLPSVENHTGLSRSEIYRRIKAGTFPTPIKLGARAVAWPAAQIEAWVNDLVGKSAQ